MRTRPDTKWDRTPGGLRLNQIQKVITDFPLLHAYGVGFSMFGTIPEQTRSKAIDYARYMLGFELDYEIDAAVSFIKVLGGLRQAHSENYVRSQYLLHLYDTWRLTHSKAPKIMPVGCIAMATLVTGGSVRVVESLKPHFLVGISSLRRQRIENYLVQVKGFQRWPDEEVYWSFENNR